MSVENLRRVSRRDFLRQVGWGLFVGALGGGAAGSYRLLQLREEYKSTRMSTTRFPAKPMTYQEAAEEVENFKQADNTIQGQINAEGIVYVTGTVAAAVVGTVLVSSNEPSTI